MYFPAITKSINKLIKRLISIHTNSQGKKINIYAEYDIQIIRNITTRYQFPYIGIKILQSKQCLRKTQDLTNLSNTHC
jgi:hypothetical protein